MIASVQNQLAFVPPKQLVSYYYFFNCMQPTVCACLVKGNDINLYSNCKIRQMNYFKKSVAHNNSCMYYAEHKIGGHKYNHERH